MQKNFRTLKRIVTYITLCSIIFWMSGIGALAPLFSRIAAEATENPPQPQFFVNGIYPAGGGIATTTFSGQINFSGAVNASTVSYNNASPDAATVILLQGRYDDFRFFDPSSPDKITIGDHDVPTFHPSVNGTDPSRLDLSLTTGGLQEATTYTLVAKNVCMTGHTFTNPQTDWPYCPMFFNTFTTIGGASYGFTINASQDAPNLCVGGKILFANEINKGLFNFNAFGNASISTIKLYVTSATDPATIIDKVKIYQDKTSSNNSNGNRILEPGLDPLLGFANTWNNLGSQNYSLTITLSPALVLPATDPNGSLGFIALDTKSNAPAGVTFVPRFQNDSFSFNGAQAASLATQAQSAITGFCSGAQVAITSSTNLGSSYIQNLAPSNAIAPLQKEVALGIDFWSASANTLASTTIDIIVPSGGTFDPQYGLNNLAANSADSGISLYKDNKSGATPGTFGGDDTLISLAAVPTWTVKSGLSKRTVLTLANPLTLPTDNTGSNAGNDYFIVLKTSSSPAPGSSFQVRVPANGFAGAFPAADFTSSPINIQSGGGMMASNILISEIQVQGGAINDEFIELYNPTSEARDISAYSIQYRDASSGIFTKKDFAPASIIPAFGFFLIAPAAYDGATTKDLLNDAFTLGNSAGTIFLISNQTLLATGNESSIKDKVAWGSGTLSPEGEALAAPAANKSLERKSWYGTTDADMAAGGMDEKMGNMQDTNNNLMDFILKNVPVPQNTTSAIENPMANKQGGEGSPVVINEIFYYPSANNYAWVELYNRSASAVTLTNWTLTFKSPSVSANNVYTFPALSISPSTFVTVWWNKTGTDSLTDAYTSNSNGSTVSVALSTLAGDLTLKDNTAAIKDYVQYGAASQPNESTAVAAHQWILGNYVNPVLQGQSIGRKGTMGDDMNRADDWQTYATPTKGAMNSGGDNFPPVDVTGVTLADNDDCGQGHTCNFGIDGRDITVSWTPDATPDPTFEKYLIFILPANAAYSVGQFPFAEIYSGQATNSFTGNVGMMKDSQNPGVTLSTGSYRAYVIAQDHSGNRSSAMVSPAATITAEGAGQVGADTQKPFIMHMSVWQAKAGADVVLMSRFADDRQLHGTTPAQAKWATSTTSTISFAKASTTPCVLLESSYYKCTIPSSEAIQGHFIGYYLEAMDAANNVTFMSASPQVDMATYANVGAYETAVKQNPFKIEIKATSEFTDADANPDISGTIYQSNGSVLANAYVFVEGTGIGPIKTNGSGVFSIADNSLMAGSWPLVVFKDGYMDFYTNAFRGDSNLSFYLNQGTMNMGGMGGGGGYMNMPKVTFTSPGDGMMGIPTQNFVMKIGFSKPMNANTIIDNDASNAGSNIYLTTTGLDRVAGIVSFNTNTNEATFTVPAETALTNGTTYTLVVTTNVTDEAGNPLSGGWRADGSFESTFTTMSDNSSLWGNGWQDALQGGSSVQGGSNQYFGGMNFDQYGQGGNMMPPFVKGTVPNPGAFNINRNTSIIIEFSEAMNSSSINSTNIKLYPVSNKASWTMGAAVGATVTLDQATQKIVTLNPSSNLDLNASNDGWYVLKVMGAVKSAKGIWLGNPQNCGTQNPDTCLASQPTYESSFQLNSSSTGDQTKPTVLGTFPKNNDGITQGTVTADVGIPAIEIGFSEAMDPDTINTQNITLTAGSKSITGKVVYDSMGNSAKFIPANALMANTQYTVTVSSSVTDLAGNPLDQDAVTVGNQPDQISFKTGSADTIAPSVLYANGDDFTIAITFSEPMIAAKQTDTNLWAYSVLNPANYYINGLTGDNPGSWNAAITLRAPYDTAGGKQLSTVNGLNFDYDEPSNTVTIKGLAFNSMEPHATDFQIFIDNVKDKSNNIIADSTNRAASGSHRNAARGPVKSSSETFGMLGPGGGGMMMMGPTSGGGPTNGPGGQTGTMAPSMNMGTMGMMKAGASPMNAMAGQTSMYFIDVPITKQISSGGKIVLTFPSGFNVASAQQDIYSPANKDFNNFATGVITFSCTDANKNCAGSQVTGDDSADSTKGGAANDGITVNSSARVVNIYMNGSTQANDFLHIDLKGIVNSSIPKEFGTDGYTVDIKTMSAEGALLESVTTMPFFINQGGSNTLEVVVNCGNTNQDTGTMTVFLGSPMTGPMEAVSTTMTDGIATSTFSNLPAGQYMVFTDPFITIGANNYLGKPMPEPITISGNTRKNITIEKEGSSGTAVTITLKGNFATGGTADSVDIFANSPSGFRVKTVTPNTDDAAVGDDSLDNTKGDHITKYQLYLPNGNWMVGMGPAMPKGPMAGPPKMPDWLPPMPLDVNVNGVTITENNGTANDGILTFDLSNQSVKSIAGKVTDGVATQTYPQGTPIADTEVFAYQPNGGFGGAHTTTAVDGTFTLKIPVLGLYKIGTNKPGLPGTKELTMDVREAGNYDATGNALTAIDGANPFILKIKKPAYTISGKVLNRNQQAVSYAPVWAWQSSGTGHADTMTDASGNYILYVDNGTWNLETDAPGVGKMQYDLPITVNGSSQSNINLRPASDISWYDISGTITIDGTAQSYIPIRAVEYNANGQYLGKEYNGTTNSTGGYTLTVPGTGSAGSYKYYRVDIWTPNYGEAGLTYDQLADSPANIKVSNTATSTANIVIAAQNLKTATMVFANKSGYSAKEAFINIDKVTFSNGVPTPTGSHKSLRVADISGANPTVKLENGDYFIFADIPGTGHYMPADTSPAFDADKKCITIDGTGDTINFTLPDLTSADAVITISGTVSGPAAGQRDAWIWVGNPETGFHTGVTAASSTGAYSLVVPKLSSGKYMIGADRPGYMSTEPASNAGTADTTADFTLTAFSYTISGKIYRDISGGTTNSYDSGEAISNGWIRADETTTGAKAFAPVDGTGSFTLGVNNGSWKVYASADGYQEAQYSIAGVPTVIAVSSANLTNKNIKLTADANWTMKTKSKPITPANGGTIDDTAQNTTTGKADGTGLKMTIPPNALGSSSSNGNVTAVETGAVAQTDSMKPFGGKAKSITATDNSGQAITNLNDYVNMEMVLYKTDIASTTDIVDKTKLKTMKVGYWDDTLNEWSNLPTTKAAYYKEEGDTEWKLYGGTATESGFDKFIDEALSATPTFTEYDDYKLEFKASTNHFSVFALGTSPDNVPPSAPTALTQSSGNGTSVALSWTAPTTNIDDTSLTDLYGYAVYRSTDDSTYSQISTSRIAAGTTAYTDTGLNEWTSYYYKVTAGDDDDQESAYSTALQVCSTKTVANGTVASNCSISCNSGYTLNEHTCRAAGGGGYIPPQQSAQQQTQKTQQTQQPQTQQTQETQQPQQATEATETQQKTQTQTQAQTEQKTGFADKISLILKEAKSSLISQINKLLTTLGIKRNLTQEQKISQNLVKPLLAKVKNVNKESQDAVTNFITYGTETTKIIGEGERAGVLNSFQKAYSRLPEKDIDWQDAIKIANGRFPAQQSIEKEKEALKVFGKIYKRMPNYKNSHDEAALKIIAYGIRPTSRRTDAEKAAILSFRNIYGRSPSTTEDWDIMRAIAYSGASR